MADIFDTFLKSKATTESYRYIWEVFLKHLKTSENNILALGRKEQEQKIVDYVKFLKDNDRSPTTIKLRLNISSLPFP